MLLLGLDTSTDAVGAAVLDTHSDRVLGRAVRIGPAAHGELLAPLVAEALSEAGIRPAGLDAIGVGRGPGPFTGLRVGLVHAEVLGMALAIPVRGVTSLDALAAAAFAFGLTGGLIVATDARRREVYWAQYRDGDPVAGPQVCSPSEVPSRDLPAVGPGVFRYPDHFSNPGPRFDLDPVWIARLAARQERLGAPRDLTPLYLRRPDATPSLSRKKVTP